MNPNHDILNITKNQTLCFLIGKQNQVNTYTHHYENQCIEVDQCSEFRLQVSLSIPEYLHDEEYAIEHHVRLQKTVLIRKG